MRVIQSSMVEVKAIQPSAAQALLNVWPPGAPRSPLLRDPGPGLGPGQGPGQEASALHQAQEKLHREGKAAVRTLRSTREALQGAMERELREQKECRAYSRAFFRSLRSFLHLFFFTPILFLLSCSLIPSLLSFWFLPRCLCSCQLTLSEDDMLKMKLEFHKCLSVMDRCLVLPHAGTRAKLHAALAAWRKETELQAENTQSEVGGEAAARKWLFLVFPVPSFALILKDVC